MLRLLVLCSQGEQVFLVPDAEVTLGSAPENDLVVRAPGISRRHAIVRRVPGGIEFLDLRSKNGIYVEGLRVEHAILIPGSRIQIGASWMEIEELSSMEAELSTALARRLSRRETSLTTTSAHESLTAAPGISSPEAALQFVSYLDLVEPNTPEERRLLIARSSTTLGAEVLISFKLQRNGTVDIHELDSYRLSPDQVRILRVTSEELHATSRNEVRLKRAGVCLVAGRGRYFLAARFSNESLAREGWRRDLLRFLAVRLLAPVKPLRRIGLTEIQRVLTATLGNKSETARILGVTRQTIHNALKSLPAEKSKQ
jgi:hypothetical protein